MPAPNDAAAAHYYPAIYWYTLMKIPPASDFGGKSAIPEKLTQNDWLKQMNNVDCIGCHQLGQESTRTIPAQFGHFNSGEEAWMRRIQSGQTGEHDDQPARRAVGRRAVQIFRRLDRPHRQGRTAQDQAAAAARRRTQRRHHLMGMGDAEAITCTT